MLFVELIKKDFKQLISYKNLILFSILLPVIIFLTLGFLFSDLMNVNKRVDQINVGIVNKDLSEASKLLIDNFKENESFTKLFNIIDFDEEDAIKKFNEGKIFSIIEIPNGFSDSLMSFENYELKVTLSELNPIKSLILKNILNSYKKYVKSTDIAVYSLYEQIRDIGIDKDEIKKINDIFSFEMIFTALSRDKLFDYIPIYSIPSTKSIEYFLIAISVMFIMYSGLIGMSFILYERKTMTLLRYKSTSSSILLFIFSKIFVLFLYSIFQISIFALPIIIIFNINFKLSLLNLILFITLAIINILSLSFFIGCIINNDESTILIGNIGIFVLSLIGGSFLPLNLIPIKIQFLSMITPNYWIIKGLLYILKGFSINHIYLNLVVLTVSSIVFLIIVTLKISKSRWYYQ